MSRRPRMNSCIWLAGQVGVHLVPEERPPDPARQVAVRRPSRARRRATSRRHGSGCRTHRAARWSGRSRRPSAAACRCFSVAIMDGGNPDEGSGQACVSVDVEGVGRDRSRLQSVQLHQRVVVTVNRERAGLPVPAAGTDGDAGSRSGLHPDTRRGLIHVPHHGAEHQGMARQLCSPGFALRGVVIGPVAGCPPVFVPAQGQLVMKPVDLGREQGKFLAPGGFGRLLPRIGCGRHTFNQPGRHRPR